MSNRFIKELDLLIKWRMGNQHDPYGIDLAVITALREVRTAWEAANTPKRIKPKRKAAK
jgi:hypothetical protein